MGFSTFSQTSFGQVCFINLTRGPPHICIWSQICPSCDAVTLLAIRKPAASIPVILSASLSPSPASFISAILVTVIEFHTETICDADTRRFCACQMPVSLSPLYLKVLPELSCQKQHQSFTAKNLPECICLLSFLRLHELSYDFQFCFHQQCLVPNDAVMVSTEELWTFICVDNLYLSQLQSITFEKLTQTCRVDLFSKSQLADTSALPASQHFG